MPLAILALVIVAGGAILLARSQGASSSSGGGRVTPAPGQGPIVIQSPAAAPSRQITAGPVAAPSPPMSMPTSKPTKTATTAELVAAAAGIIPGALTSFGSAYNENQRIDLAKQIASAQGKLPPSASGSQAKTTDAVFKSGAGAEQLVNLFAASDGTLAQPEPFNPIAIAQNQAATYFAIDQARIAQGLAPLYTEQVQNLGDGTYVDSSGVYRE